MAPTTIGQACGFWQKNQPSELSNLLYLRILPVKAAKRVLQLQLFRTSCSALSDCDCRYPTFCRPNQIRSAEYTMSTVTGFKAITATGTTTQVDAHGNNAAFACLKCHAPLLATLRDHQRGSSAAKPVKCGGCGTAYWLEVKDQEMTLIVHESPESDSDSDSDDAGLPRVIGRTTKDAGTYKLGTTPLHLAPHNQQSWDIIAAILKAYGTADYYDLAVSVRQHRHGDKAASGPQSFVSYCIRSGWLQRA